MTTRMVIVTSTHSQVVEFDGVILYKEGDRAGPVPLSGDIRNKQRQGLLDFSYVNSEGQVEEAVLTKVRWSTKTNERLLLTDNGRILVLENSDSIYLTLPRNLPVDFAVYVIQQGQGIVHFVAESGVTIQNRAGFDRTAGQYAQVGLTVIKNEDSKSAIFNLGGDGASA